VQIFAAPAIGYVEIFVHTTSLSSRWEKGKRLDHSTGNRE